MLDCDEKKGERKKKLANWMLPEEPVPASVWRKSAPPLSTAGRLAADYDILGWIGVWGEQKRMQKMRKMADHLELNE